MAALSLAVEEEDKEAIVEAAASLAAAGSHMCEVAEAALDRADAAEREAARVRVRNTPRVSGWVPGSPPPPDASAPRLPESVYAPDGVHRTPEAYGAIRREVCSIVLA